MSCKEDITIIVTKSEQLNTVSITYREVNYQLIMSDDYFTLHSCTRNGEPLEDPNRGYCPYDPTIKPRQFNILEGSIYIMITTCKPHYFNPESQTLFMMIDERGSRPKSVYRTGDTFFSDTLNIN